MAKKNLSTLMDGLMGDKQAASDEDPAPYGMPHDEPVAKAGPGRPRKVQVANGSNEIRSTIIVDEQVMKRLKYVSLVEGKMIKTVLGEAFADFLAKWEAEHGKINI